MSYSIRRFLSITGCGLAAIACSCCSVASRKAQISSRADRYFSAGHYSAAEIEYLNLLALDRTNPDAIAHLGIIYFDQGSVRRAIPFLVQGNRLDPDNLELRIKLGLYDLAVGKPADASQQALFVLGRSPADRDAPLLLAEAAGPAEISGARKRLGALPPAVAAGAPVAVALGMLDLRENHFPEAEALFQRALSVDPKSSDAAVELAALHWQEKDLSGTRRYFDRAVGLAPDRSDRRLQYAQFEIHTGDRDGARRLLEESIQRAPDYLPARILLAEMDVSDGKLGPSEAQVASVLAQDPSYPDALVLNGRLSRLQGQDPKAITELEGALRLYPHYPALDFELAEAYLAAGSTDKAMESLEQAVLTSPNDADAALALAELQIKSGQSDAALFTLKHLVKIRPDLDQAGYLLAETDVRQGDWEGALAIYRRLEQAAPAAFRPYLLAGIVLRRLGRSDEARQSLERALQLAPNDARVREQIDDLDLSERQYSAVLKRAEMQMAGNPKDAAPRLLMAKTFLAEGDLVRAESALREVVRLDPDSPGVSFVLAQIDFKNHRDAQALSDVRHAVADNPKDVGALMLMGSVALREKDYASARDAYVLLLAVDPNDGAALNDLAYLDSEIFGQLDLAQDLARRARMALPDDPYVADTLGWILYQRHQYQPALALLQESAERIPESPETQFHLGMALSMTGDESRARAALQRSLDARQDFPGIEQGRQRLSVLAIDPATATAADRKRLEDAAGSDPIVLARLAAIYWQAGYAEKAGGFYQRALRENPDNPTTLNGLAGLLASQGDWAKAFELAKAAHALAPGDPEADRTLGMIALHQGDHAWAVSLLRDASEKLPDDSGVWFDFAKASYSLGDIPGAETEMRTARDVNGPASRRAEAGQFLDLIDWARNPRRAADAAPRVEAILKADPGDLPALMAEGAIGMEKNDSAAAIRAYEEVLARDPDFDPAQRELAGVYAEHPGDDGKAVAAAARARDAFPDDPEVSKACGIIFYRHGDYAEAAKLLQDSARFRDRDGETVFFLGMAQYHLKLGSSRQTLERSLGMSLRADHAAEARRTLALLSQLAG
jgi:tetratricopeptide (TPR) repeat protein